MASSGLPLVVRVPVSAQVFDAEPNASGLSIPARERAYARLEHITFEGAKWRRDISSAANQGAAQASG